MSEMTNYVVTPEELELIKEMKIETLNQKSIFQTLSEIDVTKYIEKKPTGKDKKNLKTGQWEKEYLKYLSWMTAWHLTKSIYPNSNYDVHMFDGKPYVYDETLGYMVMTTVTIISDNEIQTIDCHLPVTDGKNDSLKDEAYIYKVKNYVNGKPDGLRDVHVEQCTMFDINTAIMRCLAKNLALHGLGWSLYVKDDLISKLEEGEAQIMPKEDSALIKEKCSNLKNMIIEGFTVIEEAAFQKDPEKATKIKAAIEKQFDKWTYDQLKSCNDWLIKLVPF